ncbi:hypothetical protein JRF84_07955 [Methylobacterium organophilum]|uniref:hypothetical protein n=1 Tax=Methylobacterium TaxID=407 RepID=UPI0019D1899F|nr:hypothetical protein [Methylobacterium organophilum]MBN6819522.1 hypothetical protein [Methylobacterium organophilum]
MLTVLTPAATARLATPADVRLDLGLAEGTPPDAALLRRIDQASADVVRVCQRTFGRQIYRERIHSLPREGFVLSAGPVNRIISLSIMGGAAFAPEEYLLANDTLRLTYGGSGGGIGDGSAYNLWCSLRPTLVVDYEAGWLLPGEEVGEDFTGATPLPADVEKAVIQLIGVAMSESGRDMTIRSENVQGVGSTTYNVQGAGSALPHPGAEAALQPYRMLALA